jgi:hypothetical protein
MAGPKTWIKDGSVWTQITNIWRKSSSGIWEPGEYVWRKIGETWKICIAYSGPPPAIVNISCIDSTITLSNTSWIFDVGSASITIYWTGNDMTGTPCTVYVYVQKSGPVDVANGSKPNCNNGIAKSVTLTANEAAVSGRTYYVYLSTSNPNE